jgi:hypothetical protein
LTFGPFDSSQVRFVIVADGSLFLKQVDEVSFAPVCHVRDSCYDQLFADPTICDEKVATCNDAFNAAILQRCDQLPNGCQRSLCYSNVVADTFSDLVEAAEDYYKAAAGCVK